MQFFLANHKCEQFPDCDILNVVVIDREPGQEKDGCGCGESV